MKKYLCIILIVATFINNVCFAEEQSFYSITFRNMDWLIQPGTFLSELIADGINIKYSVEYAENGSWKSPPGVKPNWNYRPVPRFYLACSGEKDESLCKVAGYNVKQINAYFLAGIDEKTGDISKNVNDSILVYASYVIYSFDQDTPSSLYDTRIEMIKKMNNIYGDYIIDTDLLGQKVYCWVAKDNTVVSMQIQSFLLNDWEIRLRYEFNAESYTKELHKKTQSSNIGDVNGL